MASMNDIWEKPGGLSIWKEWELHQDPRLLSPQYLFAAGTLFIMCFFFELGNAYQRIGTVFHLLAVLGSAIAVSNYRLRYLTDIYIKNAEDYKEMLILYAPYYIFLKGGKQEKEDMLFAKFGVKDLTFLEKQPYYAQVGSEYVTYRNMLSARNEEHVAQQWNFLPHIAVLFPLALHFMIGEYYFPDQTMYSYTIIMFLLLLMSSFVIENELWKRIYKKRLDNI